MVKATLQTPLGDMVATSDGSALTGLWFVGQAHFPKDLPTETASELAVFTQTQQWLDAYFAKASLPQLPALNPCGTAFQQAVWQQLCAIPFGQTTSYGAIGKAIRKPTAGQAIGGAVGRNPISVVIPCHRVLGADGSLTGYAGGLERKVALLEIEENVL